MLRLFKPGPFFKNCVCNRYMSSLKCKPKSSLFISGKRAKDTFVTVVPHLDFDYKFSNVTNLEDNIKRRKLDIDVLKLKSSWEFYSELNEKKLVIQNNLDKAGKQINELSKTENSDEKKENFEKLERYRNLLREELQFVKNNVWGLEDSVIGELLLIPNDLHPQAPYESEHLCLFSDENLRDGCNHLDKGEELDCLEYKNEVNYFLKNKAALLELGISEYFVDQFVGLGFIRFFNPDFTRSVLAEGIGLPPEDTSETFLLEQTEGNNDYLHLCGGASLFPFCGYHAKHSVAKQSLPLKYIASGRLYSPATTTLSTEGLYSVIQSTSVQIFIATHSQEELYHEFQFSIKNLERIFRDLGLNFKLVKQPPHFYKSWDSLRVSIQVYSTYNKDFIEVGHISLVDDYISKRLRMSYVDKKDEPFLKIISCEVVNVQKLLGLCLERSQSDLFIPNCINEYMIY